MRKLSTAVLVLVAIAFTSAARAEMTGQSATLYKNPQCACCDEYVRHLEEAGMIVEMKSTTDLSLVKKQAGVPEKLAGCHTMLVDGYVLEGLVPLNVVERLLSEKPDIRGISLPGMPVGAPGMPGPKDGPFTIYEITPDASNVYAVE